MSNNGPTFSYTYIEINAPAVIMNVGPVFVGRNEGYTRTVNARHEEYGRRDWDEYVRANGGQTGYGNWQAESYGYGQATENRALNEAGGGYEWNQARNDTSAWANTHQPTFSFTNIRNNAPSTVMIDCGPVTHTEQASYGVGQARSYGHGPIPENNLNPFANNHPTFSFTNIENNAPGSIMINSGMNCYGGQTEYGNEQVESYGHGQISEITHESELDNNEAHWDYDETAHITQESFPQEFQGGQGNYTGGNVNPWTVT